MRSQAILDLDNPVIKDFNRDCKIIYSANSPELQKILKDEIWIKQLLEEFNGNSEDRFHNDLKLQPSPKKECMQNYISYWKENKKLFDIYRQILPYLKIILSNNTNSEDNLQLNASWIAFKLVTIFGEKQSIIKYLSSSIKSAMSEKFESKKEVKEIKQEHHKEQQLIFYNINEYLNFEIPTFSNWNIKLWQKVYKSKMDNSKIRNIVLKFTDEIEKKLQLKNIKLETITTEQLLENVGYCLYKDLKEITDPDSALLFYSHHVESSSAADWLALTKEAKSSEYAVPAKSLFLDGDIIGIPDLYLAKFDDAIPDSRIAITGLITQDCQWIGGTGRKYLVSALKSPNAGFLAIGKGQLKKLDKLEKKPALTDKKEVDSKNYYLRKNTKDKDIISNSLIWISPDQKSLVFDSIEIQPIFRKKSDLKKIFKMYVKCADQFINNSQVVESVFLGNASLIRCILGNYFLLSDKDIEAHKDLTTESDIFPKYIMASKSLPLYSRLVYEPNYIFSVKKAELDQYDLQHIFLLCMNFGDITHLKYLLELFSEEELIKIDPLIIACKIKNPDYINFIKNHNIKLLWQPERDYSPLIYLSEKTTYCAYGPHEIIQSINSLLKDLDKENLSRIFFLKSRLPLRTSILAFFRHDPTIFKHIINIIPDKETLFRLIMQKNDNSQNESFISGIAFQKNTELFDAILSRFDLNEEDIYKILIPEEKNISPLLLSTPSTKHVQYIMEHKKISSKLKKEILLMDFNTNNNSKQVNFLGSLLNNAEGVIHYLFNQSDVLNLEEKKALLAKKDRNHYLCFHKFAASNAYLNLLKELFSLNEDILPAIDRNKIFHSITNTGDHLLTLSLGHNLTPTVAYLLNLPDFPNEMLYAPRKDGMLPLEIALSNKNIESAKLLLEKMILNKHLFTHFIQEKGHYIYQMLKDTPLHTQWGTFLNENVIKHQLYLSPTDYIATDKSLSSRDKRKILFKAANDEKIIPCHSSIIVNLNILLNKLSNKIDITDRTSGILFNMLQALQFEINNMSEDKSLWNIINQWHTKHEKLIEINSSSNKSWAVFFRYLPGPDILDYINFSKKTLQLKVASNQSQFKLQHKGK